MQKQKLIISILIQNSNASSHTHAAYLFLSGQSRKNNSRPVLNRLIKIKNKSSFLSVIIFVAYLFARFDLKLSIPLKIMECIKIFPKLKFAH